MDTTNFLLELLHAKKEPGGVPLIKPEHLVPVENRLTLPYPEIMLHLAGSFNEPVVVSYVLDRYQLDPNEIVDGTSFSTYMYLSMFCCWDVLEVFLQRKLFPESWYIFFLFAFLHGETELIDRMVAEYPNKITLQPEENSKLLKFSVTPTLTGFLLRAK